MIYVTSDLHGFSLDKFKGYLEQVSFSDDDFLYVLGDVIDRGPDGIRILKWLMSKSNAQLILGNHEAMMLACDFLLTKSPRNPLTDLRAQSLTRTSHGHQTVLSPLSMRFLQQGRLK